MEVNRCCLQRGETQKLRQNSSPPSEKKEGGSGRGRESCEGTGKGGDRDGEREREKRKRG